ncbi:MAG: hypothetical protein A2511_06770 [Deltaproteobacteria bacterium RIFOXYD12_FULL_50_9]|nr:MAG: hypothetical protein A2511_06770 [Deltaproteobacteria bacterium RIFOXYD12_FULL_50_9]
MRCTGETVFSTLLAGILCFITIFTGVFCSPSPIFAKTKTAKQVAYKSPEPVPTFYDDFDLESLDKAVAASLKYLKVIPPGKKFQVCGGALSAAALAGSLQDLAALIKRSKSAGEFNRQVREKFEVCRIGDGEIAGKVLVTGYFEPLVNGSLEKKKPYLIPLYRVPGDLVVTKDRDGKSVIGRQAANGVVPYWTREEIEKNGHLAGSELVYVDDPVSAFVLQIQGSGRVRLRDGSIRPIQFAGKNGRPYSSIGKLLVEQGVMPLADVTLPRIREYLDQHPEEREKILHHNESFIFFKWGDSSARGAIGEVLIPGRSVALDHKSYPPGIMAILHSRKPIVDDKGEVKEWRDFTRFVLNQDAGSAIKGPGRVDLFLGSGRYAEIAAGLMRQPGTLYLLVKKK